MASQLVGMRASILTGSVFAGSVFAGLLLLTGPTPAQAPPALAGKVSSQAEGAMEGVLVSARKDGSTVRLTVATDAQGRYSFPPGKLEAGHYALTIRAAGYDLAGVSGVDIAPGRTATADITLRPTRRLPHWRRST